MNDEEIKNKIADSKKKRIDELNSKIAVNIMNLIYNLYEESRLGEREGAGIEFKVFNDARFSVSLNHYAKSEDAPTIPEDENYWDSYQKDIINHMPEEIVINKIKYVLKK